MTESFGSSLADARSLLVLDNCEHLTDQCARVVDALISSCGELQVLATSREPLGVAGEHLFRLQPLALPSAEVGMAVGESEAGMLFVARATAQQPLFHLDETNAPLVASICRRLDGMPLAIELAACRLRAMSIEELDRRLDQRLRVLTGGSRTALPRHQTLAATIAWSYNLLSASEQRLLERLAVFHDGFDLASAETVGAEQGPGAPEVLDGVTSLVDKSLVQAEFPFSGARYRLLETVRAFALDRLSERAGEPVATRTRHARAFLEMSEEASTHWFGPDESPWLDRLERNHENLNAAIRLYLETADGIGEALRLCGALRIYWRRRGKYVEGAALVERVLETEPGSQDKRLRAVCLRTAGSLLFDIGDTPAARARLAEGVELATEVKDLELLDGCLHEIAFILLRQGAHERGPGAHRSGRGPSRAERRRRAARERALPSWQVDDHVRSGRAPARPRAGSRALPGRGQCAARGVRPGRPRGARARAGQPGSRPSLPRGGSRLCIGQPRPRPAADLAGEPHLGELARR